MGAKAEFLCVALSALAGAAPLNAALREAFSASDASTALTRLRRLRDVSTSHATALALEPCGIHIRTRERADAVRDALDDACAALDARTSSPAAIAATYMALNQLFASRPPPRGLATAERHELALQMDLALDAQLRARPDATHGARVGQPPEWQPSKLDGEALEVARSVCAAALPVEA